MTTSNSCNHGIAIRSPMTLLILLLVHVPHLVNARVSSSTSNRHGLAGKVIAGIVVAIVCGILLCILLALLSRRMRRGRGSSGYAAGTGFAPFGRRQAGYAGTTDYEAGGGYGQGGNPGYGPGVGTGAGAYAPPVGAPPGAPPPPYTGGNKEAGVGGFAPPPGPPPPPSAHIPPNKPSNRFSGGWFGDGNKAQ